MEKYLFVCETGKVVQLESNGHFLKFIVHCILGTSNSPS